MSNKSLRKFIYILCTLYFFFNKLCYLKVTTLVEFIIIVMHFIIIMIHLYIICDLILQDISSVLIVFNTIPL